VYALGADGSSTAHPVGAQGLRDLTFVDPLHGWVIGDGGQVYATADGGSTWSPQGTVSSAVTGVGFGDALHGLAVGPSTISDTVDGGQTWSNVDPGVGNLGDLSAVATPDAGHFWAVGHDGSIYAAAFPDASGLSAGGGGGAGGGGASIAPSSSDASGASQSASSDNGTGSPSGGDTHTFAGNGGNGSADWHTSSDAGSQPSGTAGAGPSNGSAPSSDGAGKPDGHTAPPPSTGTGDADPSGQQDPPAPSTATDPGNSSAPTIAQSQPSAFIGEPPSPAATPELDSMTLLGSGLLGLGGYALLRRRARRR
jgi:hypothetical protein